MIFGYILIGGFALFIIIIIIIIIIAAAVKMAAKEALYEFGEDFIKELKKVNADNTTKEIKDEN